MKLASRLVALWRNIVHRERGERDLDDEVHSTVDALTDEKMRAGVPPDAARRAALTSAMPRDCFNGTRCSRAFTDLEV